MPTPLQPAETHEITGLLLDWSQGDPSALEPLALLVFDELRRIAHSHMDHERVDHTLQTTALVHELFIRLDSRRTVNWKNRAHFFGFASQLMRRILVDHARTRAANKRNAGMKPLPLEAALEVPVERDLEILALNEALRELEALDPRQSQAVELFYFVGLTYSQIGEVLGVSEATAKRQLLAGRAWLRHWLQRDTIE